MTEEVAHDYRSVKELLRTAVAGIEELLARDLTVDLRVNDQVCKELQELLIPNQMWAMSGPPIKPGGNIGVRMQTFADGFELIFQDHCGNYVWRRRFDFSENRAFPTQNGTW